MIVAHQLKLLQEHIGKEFSASPSPFMKWLNPTVIEASEGKVTFRYVVRDEMTNPIGTLHGGITAAIVDDSIGATMFTFNEEHFYTTLNNVIDYFSAVRPGDVILAETMVIKKGKQFVNVQCEIWNEDRTRLIARGTSNLFKTTLKK
jgi:uncharacterized protein (TIGR00369 family)